MYDSFLLTWKIPVDRDMLNKIFNSLAKPTMQIFKTKAD